jgi:hypothetical protein
MQVCDVVGVQQRSPPVPSHLPVKLQGLLQQCLQVDRSLRPTAKVALQVRTVLLLLLLPASLHHLCATAS